MIRKAAAEIKPLHSKLGKPKPGEWLDKHRESGQTFDEYLRDHKQRVVDQYRTIYVQPLGGFDETRQKLLGQATDFLGRFYGMPVKSLDAITLGELPESAKRIHPRSDDRQILTGYVLENVLKPRRPKDAVAVLGLTTSDLWPGEGWNFVFGQASLTERVGVWSIYRFGEPDKDAAEYKQCLRRTLATAAHETGHMLGFKHCTAYQCGMNGSNHLEEADSRPLEFCPECQAKLWWTCAVEPRERYRKLLEFAERNNLDGEAAYWRKAIEQANVHTLK